MKITKPLFICLIFFIILFIFIYFFMSKINNSTIFYGVKINNIDVSNMSKEQANYIFSKIVNDKINDSLELVCDNYSTFIYFSTFDINYDISSAISKAFDFGRSGNFIQNSYQILKLLLFGENININISLDSDFLKSVILDISSNLPDKVTQPSYYIEDDNLIISRGSAGVIIDENEFIKNFYRILSNFSYKETKFNIPIKSVFPNDINIDQIYIEVRKKAHDAYYEENPLKIYPEVIGIDFDIESAKSQIKDNLNDSIYVIKLNYEYPNITLKNLNIDIFPDLLATFSTTYDVSNINRSTNLKLASDKINGFILAPSESFSYNKIVGERTLDGGYKPAKMYANGKIVDGIGGGICQISTTLYNAVILANLDVIERSNHQFLTSYISAGRDSSVSYGYKDLKFINTRNFPIKILISVNNGVVKVDIYGIKEDLEYDVNFDVETVSDISYNIIYEEDDCLNFGNTKIKQNGVNGIIVNTYKILKRNNSIISKELISKDIYNALDKIILINTSENKN